MRENGGETDEIEGGEKRKRTYKMINREK